MELHEYPRPANDTGIGVHWSVGFASAGGMGRIRDFWIPELKAMGVKWVKIANHDGAIDFAELLLAEDIMPIVRIFRPSPNPGVLDVRELVHLDALVRVGVRYFEFNNEPDQDSEWKGGRVPANGLDLVVEHTIANMETILERGGMPAVPALSNGCRWDLVGKIVARGRRDLFDGPVWQAIHNYSQNRPMDYPYDIGNQEGAAYTQRFYAAIASEKWQEDSWRGRALSEINQLRVDRSNPGRHHHGRPCVLAGVRVFRRAQSPAHRAQHPHPVHRMRLPGRRGHGPALSGDVARPAHGADAGVVPRHDGHERTLCLGAGLLFLHGLLAAWQRGAGQHERLVRADTRGTAIAGRAGRCRSSRALKAEPKSVRRWMGMAEVGLAQHVARRGAPCRATGAASCWRRAEPRSRTRRSMRTAAMRFPDLLPGTIRCAWRARASAPRSACCRVRRRPSSIWT